MPTERVLVVVPTLNEAAHIGPILQGLLAEEAWLPGLRVAVVDGGSTDGTVESVRQVAEQHPQVALVHNPARIQSAGVNLAARLFGRHADVLIRCDAHAGYPPDYCRRLVQRLADAGPERVDAVVVPLDSAGQGRWQRAVAWLSNTPLGTGGSAHRGGRRSGFVDHGHHAAFRMDLFRRAGGYDETFTHNEDAELDCRQRALGGRIYLDASIRVVYRPRATPGALWRQYFRYGAGRSRTARRHPGSLRLRQLAVPIHWLVCLLAIAVAPVWPWALVWPLLYLGVLAGAAVALSVRHRAAGALLAAPAAVIMHAAWAAGFFAGLATRRERRWHVGLARPLWTAAGVAS